MSRRRLVALSVCLFSLLAGCGAAAHPECCPETRPVNASATGQSTAEGTTYRDSDSDMILDACDECPDEPETFNGYKDDDGCPEAVVVTDQEDMFLDHVYFEHGSAELSSRQHEMVEAEAKYWIRHPEIERLACVGRAADNEADPLQLSFARSRALCDRLEQLGVAPTRLVAYGLGYRAPPDPDTNGDRERSMERSATTVVMLANGKRLYRWDGVAVRPVRGTPRYRPEPPPPAPPRAPVCPALKRQGM